MFKYYYSHQKTIRIKLKRNVTSDCTYAHKVTLKIGVLTRRIETKRKRKGKIGIERER